MRTLRVVIEEDDGRTVKSRAFKVEDCLAMDVKTAGVGLLAIARELNGELGVASPEPPLAKKRPSPKIPFQKSSITKKYAQEVDNVQRAD